MEYKSESFKDEKTTNIAIDRLGFFSFSLEWIFPEYMENLPAIVSLIRDAKIKTGKKLNILKWNTLEKRFKKYRMLFQLFTKIF